MGEMNKRWRCPYCDGLNDWQKESAVDGVHIRVYVWLLSQNTLWPDKNQWNQRVDYAFGSRENHGFLTLFASG